MALDQIPSGGNRDHDAGAGLITDSLADEPAHGPGGGPPQLREQLAAAAEQGSQQPRDRQDDVAGARPWRAPPLQPFGPQDLSLLLARGTEGPAAAGEGHPARCADTRPPQRRARPAAALPGASQRAGRAASRAVAAVLYTRQLISSTPSPRPGGEAPARTAGGQPARYMGKPRPPQCQGRSRSRRAGRGARWTTRGGSREAGSGRCRSTSRTSAARPCGCRSAPSRASRGTPSPAGSAPTRCSAGRRARPP